MTVQIRRAVLEDAGPLAALAVSTFRDTYAADNSPDDMELHIARSYGHAQQLAEIASPDIVTLLAVAGGPAAFAQLRKGPAPACVSGARPVELWRFYVDKAWHGRGLAGQLMNAALEQARSDGAATIWLGVWERNLRAIAFYRKFGFAEVGVHDYLFGAHLEKDRVMARNLR